VFYTAYDFNADVSGWDVSSVANMYRSKSGVAVLLGELRGRL